jgi:chitin disaccharide deacetylase
MKELVVNADDFGRSAAINRGIAEAHERGIVTSASLMVRWPAAGGAAAYARSRSRLGVGLHLDLGDWAYRGGTWVALYERVDVTDLHAVSEELDRQLTAFQALLGCPPTHLDSHQHVHLDGAVREAVVATGRSLDVPVRRITSSIAYRGDFYGQTGQGEPLPERITPEALVAILGTLSEGVTELACHPGLGEEESSYAGERTRETAALCDPEVRKAVAQAGARLHSFAGLRFGSAEVESSDRR